MACLHGLARKAARTSTKGGPDHWSIRFSVLVETCAVKPCRSDALQFDSAITGQNRRDTIGIGLLVFGQAQELMENSFRGQVGVLKHGLACQ